MKKKGRIGLVLSKVPSYSETFLRNKISVLQREGFEVFLFAGGGRKSTDGIPGRVFIGYNSDDGIPIRILKATKACLRLLAEPASALALFRRNREDGFDWRTNTASLIHTAHILRHRVDWLHFGFATIAFNKENLARVVGAKMAISLRGYDISILPLKSPGCYERIWKKTDKLHYISDALYRLALADGLEPSVAAMKIEPAVDPSVLERMPPHQPSVDGTIRFLTIGRLTWKKGYGHVLHALSNLKSEGLRFTYRIVGEGEGYEEILYLRRLLGLDDHVILEGRKSHSETLELLNRCDLYLQYSVQEGFCNAVLEAQMFGKPCIVSDAQGLPENVLHGRTGWVVPSSQPALLADAIRNVLALPDSEREAVCRNAAERIRNEFSLEAQGRKFIDFYTE